MAVEIYLPEKVYLAPSSIHGYGVFAKNWIRKGEIIEECPVIRMELDSSAPCWHVLESYRFNWPCGIGKEVQYQAMPAGYGAIYNHSNNNNAIWKSSESRETFIFYALRDIAPREEIFTYYGEGYWGEGNRLKPEELK